MARTELGGTGLIMQRIEPRLSGAVWRLGRQHAARVLVSLEDGSATIEGSGTQRRLDGPVLCWLNQSAGVRLVVTAGSTGHVLEMSDDLVVSLLAELQDGTAGGGLVGHDLVIGLSAGGEPAATAMACLNAIEAETAVPRRGGNVIVAAQLRILMVALLRLSGFEETEPQGSGANARFLRRFRQLVENNYRAHWPVARYAQTIGISPDRLHSICRSALGKPPKALLNERIAREAGLGLERSTLSIEQLSHALGFQDPAHFSHFFKRMTGLSPVAFRRIRARADRDAASPANFADWP